MKKAIIGAGKWELAIIGHYLNKVRIATLTLCRLQQSAHATGYIEGEFA